MRLVKDIAVVSAVFPLPIQPYYTLLQFYFLLKGLCDSSLWAAPPHCSFKSKYNIFPIEEMCFFKKEYCK